MLQVTLRFYGDLNDLLWVGHTDRTVKRQLAAPTSVKDLIEGCGVPHTEVDLILIDGEPVDFSYLVKENEHISVYPFFHQLDLPESNQLQVRKPSANHFLADTNLGKLARHLRMAGFDTAYIRKASDKEVIHQLQEENRILLSRDRKLLMHKVIAIGYLPRSDDPAEQLQEVFRRFVLYDEIDPFSRCPNCNGVLQSVDKEEVIDQLEPLTKKHFDDFSQCPGCGQVYWAGSHRQRLDERVKRLLGIEN